MQCKMLLTSLQVCSIGHRHGFTRPWEEEDLIDAARCSTDTLGLLDVVLGLCSASHHPHHAGWDYFSLWNSFHRGNMDPVSPTADVNLQNTWWGALISLGRRRNQPAELTGLFSSCCVRGAVAELHLH